VGLANQIRNVPTTHASLDAATALKNDPHFKTFLDIAANPNTATTPASPNGGAYQVTFQEWIYKYQEGKVKGDLHRALAAVDKKIDDDVSLSR
jgi:multiple sugar transport system substrate-binding protein